MPRKAYKKRRPKRGAKRHRRVHRTTAISRGTVIPQRFFTRLRYVSLQIGTTTTISPGYYQFAANGLNDPNLTGGGHQPMGFDQLSALYKDYRVHAVKVKVQGRMLTGTSAGYVFLGCNGGVGLPNGLQALLESNRYRHKIVTSENEFTITGYFPIHQVFGKSKKVFQAAHNAASGIGDNPDLLGYINVLWQNLDGATSTGWNMRAELTYLCEFNNSKVLALS